MFTKVTLGLAKVLELKANPIVKIIKADPAAEPDLIGEEKIKSIGQLAMSFNQILKKVVGPILSAIGIAAVIYAIYLGVMFAKAESADKRKDIQGRLIGACIGGAIVIVGATLCFALNWAQIWWSFTGEKHEFTDKPVDNYCDWCGGAAGGDLHK